jgi:TRAP-type C4-dicarboxylate transport system substrate-binding protein
MSDADKEKFKQAGHESAMAMRKYVDDIEQSGVESVKKDGMQVNQVDHDAFVKAVEPVYPQYYKQFGQELVDSIRNTK